MAFKLPSIRVLPRKLNCNLPTFDYKELRSMEFIGQGGFGFVYKAHYRKETVVVKKNAGESREDEDVFLKEAKLIHSFRHENIVGFKGFCHSPCAMLLEYVYFDFSPFGDSKVISNLGDFLNHMDRIDGFENFDDKLHGKICSDIANGLSYLHERDTAHRDLKPKNILVCNSHYCHINEDEQRCVIFEKSPIICKLADFGESKSSQIQTAIINSTTRRVDRGTPLFMAPEILVKASRLQSASFKDLKQIDMWAFGMILFCIANPDLKYPYQLDINHGTSFIDQLQELLIKKKHPTGSPKYREMRSTKWLLIQKVFEASTSFDPSQRPSAEHVKQQFSAVQQINDQDQTISNRNTDENTSKSTEQRNEKEVTGLSDKSESPMLFRSARQVIDLTNPSSPSEDVRKTSMAESKLIDVGGLKSRDEDAALTYSEMDFNSSNESTDSIFENVLRRRTRVDSTDESSDADTSDSIDYYKGNLLLPVV
ncbi:probable serine/threonine-protein kinase DDB_G0278665 [Dendronephthya gigantea]|uniref:probable serine/threonine-protein kinase DDB_G0278665 n=1 Tax=Dendronephthya gigantea TaxID=151771 RepID=UPI00106CC546|nr:probable serine/threonine-protein kinase DDB_G0278665 [Dendronephthya gigantea]